MGSTVINALKGLSRPQRESLALQAAIDGRYTPWPLLQVPCGPGSYFLAWSDYFAIGDESDFLRMPLSGPNAQAVADVLGMHLMTARMVDRLWVAAKLTGIVTAPIPIPPDQHMESLERLVDHEKRVNAALSQAAVWRGLLIAGHKKDVVISPKMLQRPGWLAFYGWHKKDGTPIQGLNLNAHVDGYADYSHGVRLVAPSMVVNGKYVLVADVLADPQLCDLLSGEGPVVGVRYAAVQKESSMKIPPTIKLGSKGEDVKRWQSAVNAYPDGSFGPKTEAATKLWQAGHGLTADGVVGPKTWASWLSITERKTDPAMAEEFPFVQARYGYGRGTNVPKLIVIHTMEWGETVNTAENCAAMFAGAQSPKSSAHYCVDSNSIVQCVHEDAGAWHCPGSVQGKEINRCSIGVEHAGYAKQTPEQWADEYSTAMLRLSAQLVGALCKRYSIPVRHLSKAELLAGESGLVGHVDCTNATGTGSHWDPGPNFPWDAYLEMVAEYAV